jgi:hypothetical protein
LLALALSKVMPVAGVVLSRVGGREAPAEVGAKVETLCFSFREGTPKVDDEGGARVLLGLKSATEIEP